MKIEEIINKLEDCIKEPVMIEEDFLMGEAYEYTNFFALDPTTNECQILYDYIKELQQELTDYKEKYLNAVSDYEYEKSKNQEAIEWTKHKLNLIPKNCVGEVTLGIRYFKDLLEILDKKDKEEEDENY